MLATRIEKEQLTCIPFLSQTKNCSTKTKHRKRKPERILLNNQQNIHIDFLKSASLIFLCHPTPPYPTPTAKEIADTSLANKNQFCFEFTFSASFSYGFGSSVWFCRCFRCGFRFSWVLIGWFGLSLNFV